MSVLPSPAASATDVGNAEDGTGSNAGTRRALGPQDATPVRTPGGRFRPAGILDRPGILATQGAAPRPRCPPDDSRVDRDERCSAAHAAFRRRQTDTWLRPGPAAAWGGVASAPVMVSSGSMSGVVFPRPLGESHDRVQERCAPQAERRVEGREGLAHLKNGSWSDLRPVLCARPIDADRRRSTPNADGGRDASGVLGPTSRVADRRP
jgi:hypothetical protein